MSCCLQLRAMMQMHGSKADASKLQRLEQSLSQERSEVIKLQSAVSRLEQANQEVGEGSRWLRRVAMAAQGSWSCLRLNTVLATHAGAMQSHV